MLREVAGNCDCRKKRTEKKMMRNAAVLSAAFLLLIGFTALAAVDVSIESLQIGWVVGDTSVDRSLGLDQALVGDTVRVSARIKNLGDEAVGQFTIDFFFTETISGEHGKIGSQTVSGLEPGEESRPVVTFDSSSFIPGIYTFSAEVDPLGMLTESDLCNNVAPLEACNGSSAERTDKYQLTLLQSGRHISELEIVGTFSICRMGKLETSLAVDVYNVGTESISASDLSVYGYYRLSLDPPANVFQALRADTSGEIEELQKFFGTVTAGNDTTIFLTLDYSEFDVQFNPSDTAADAGEVLGKANPVQLRLSVQPTIGGSPQDIYLPEQFALSQFYSEVDLWTFPKRTVCQCDDYSDITSVDAKPVVAGGLVFHVVNTASGSRLHVLKIGSGEEKLDPWTAPGGSTLSSPAAYYDATTQTYRVYVGSIDGKVYALDGSDKEDESSFLTQAWETSASSLVSGTAFLSLAESGTRLLVGSEAGAYLLDTATGDVLRDHNSYDVSVAPVYEPTSGTIWVADDAFVYGINASGTACEYDAVDIVTTPLLLNGDGTALFFGTDQGELFVLGSGAEGNACTEIAAGVEAGNIRTVSGMSLVSNDGDAVIYLAGDTGVMERFEYDHGRSSPLSRDRGSERDFEPSRIELSPAILPNADGDDALAVFYVGDAREGRSTRPILQAMERELGEYEKVSVWGKSVPMLFKPEEDKIPATLLEPVVDYENGTLLVASSAGYLYAFDIDDLK